MSVAVTEEAEVVLADNPPIWRAEYPFASQYYSLGDFRMHYVHNAASASDAPVLCVHGNPTWSFYYRRILLGLPRQRVYAVDHVGCGLSDKPQRYRYTLRQHADNLKSLIEHLQLERITLLAHDWGGAIGMLAATEMPERFERIMLLNTAAFPPPYVPWRIAACRLPLFGSWAIRYGNLFARAATRMTINRLPRLPAPAAAGLLAPYDRPAHRVAIDGFVRDIPLTRRHPTYAVLEQLERQLPTLADKPASLVWGMQDWCFRPECLERLADHLPRAHRVELPDVGHYVMEEAADEVLAELNDLLRR